MAKDAKLSLNELFWLSANGPLNKNYGVTGSYGPFGTLGPYGDNWWNATPSINHIRSWSDFSELLDHSENPLFLGTEFGQELTGLNFGVDSSRLLGAGGVLQTLGPYGLGGFMGVGGPLGPHGIHPFIRDEIGFYKDEKGKRVTSLWVQTLDGKKRFPLYELYKKAAALKENNLDSSFVAEDSLSSSSPHVYKFKASSKRWINITLISAYTLDSLSIALKDHQGKLIESSHDKQRSNFINFKVNKSETFFLEVKLINSYQFLKKPYRLFVTEAPAGVLKVKR